MNPNPGQTPPQAPAQAAGQGQPVTAQPRPAYMYQPQQIRTLPTLSDDEKTKYENGLRQYWNKVNSLPSTHPEHIQAKNSIVKFSEQLVTKIQQRRAGLAQQQQAAAAGQAAQQGAQQQQTQQNAQGQAQAATTGQGQAAAQAQNRPTPQQATTTQAGATPQAQAAANGGAAAQGAPPPNAGAARPQPQTAQSAQAAQAAQAAALRKLPDHIQQHVNKLGFRAPPNAPDSAKWIEDMRDRFGRALNQMEQAKKNLLGMEKLISERNAQGKPLNEKETATYNSRKETLSKSYAEAARWVEGIRKQQGLVNSAQVGQPQASAAAPATANQQGGAPQNVPAAQNAASAPAATPVPVPTPVPAPAQTPVNAAVDAAKNQQPASRPSPVNGVSTPTQPQQRLPTNPPAPPQQVQTQTQPQAQPQPQAPTQVQIPRPEAHHPPPVNTALPATIAAQNQGVGTPSAGAARVQTPQTTTPVVPGGPTRALSHSAALNLANARATNTPGSAPIPGQPAAAGTNSPAPGTTVNQSVMGSGAQHQQGHPHAHPTTQSQQTIQSKMPIPKQLPERATAVPQGVNIGGGVHTGRPTVSQGSGTLGGVMNQPAMAKVPAYSHEAEGDHVLSKKKLDELVRQVCGGSADGVDGNLLTPEVEENVLSLADSFLDNVLHSACRNAKERGSKVLEIRDIQLVLERAYNIRVPGYSSDELRTVRKIQPSAGWIAKMSAVQAAKVMPGKGE